MAQKNFLRAQNIFLIPQPRKKIFLKFKMTLEIITSEPKPSRKFFEVQEVAQTKILGAQKIFQKF